ncbi:transcriptional regulator, ArsR family protein [Pseudooceanicola batsensis HTCC2597]|uniref:Transcriptional regulator, ArsR family protein n=1 Tax=Pseudooceanicola batsensis (strain ATCC BAA-863 / DSM 15984 / KCTC 12145 / HTCC2597) TaxID=252305 RepID=A3TYD7_PSEBH|nr:metalloregulator ArsR/SmtB family transcription factor [Pseudooceanicola batsensis]EAQ03171.1 transcriptional regulator, ArsR family protein [Pseudooceanicola batsensis HTCC2597]
MTRLTRTFAALSDDTRFALVDKLIRRGELSAGTLAAETEISAPAISRHLRVLREAGVITQRAQGTHRYYAANADALRAIHGWTMDHRAFWSGSLDRLDTLIALDPEGDDR